MATWSIRGVDRETGEPRKVTIEAANQEGAIMRAGQRGIVVEKADAMRAAPPDVPAADVWSRPVTVGFLAERARTIYLMVIMWTCRVAAVLLLLAGLYRAIEELRSRFGGATGMLLSLVLFTICAAAIAGVGELLAEAVRRRRAS